MLIQTWTLVSSRRCCSLGLDIWTLDHTSRGVCSFLTTIRWRCSRLAFTNGLTRYRALYLTDINLWNLRGGSLAFAYLILPYVS